MKDTQLDTNRPARLGFPEIIYGESKSMDQLQRILQSYEDRQENVLITRLQPEKADVLTGEYDEVARTLTRLYQPPAARPGRIAVVSAGTSDAPVVGEAANTLRFLGIDVVQFQDVGVAGIHRLMERMDALSACDAIICVAGFEGALASVVAGMLPQPIIGVPTSVGYGVAAAGQTALHAMLASCANGLMVMNIDNGCGAALAAARILRGKA